MRSRRCPVVPVLKPYLSYMSIPRIVQRMLVAGLMCLGPAIEAQQPAPRPVVTSTGPDVFLVPLTASASTIVVGVPTNVTQRDGYDNQPAFALDSRALFYTMGSASGGQTDIMRFDLGTRRAAPAPGSTPESEYSAFPLLNANANAIAVIRVELDSAQRLWRMPFDGSAPSVLFPSLKPVGYFAQANDSTFAMFVLGSPATLQVGIVGRSTLVTLAHNVGRSLHRIPGTSDVSYVQKGPNHWYVMRLNVQSHRVDTLATTLPRSEDMAWVDGTTMVMGQGSSLFVLTIGANAAWTPLADFATAGLSGITRLAVSPDRRWIAVVADGKPPQ